MLIRRTAGRRARDFRWRPDWWGARVWDLPWGARTAAQIEHTWSGPPSEYTQDPLWLDYGPTYTVEQMTAAAKHALLRLEKLRFPIRVYRGREMAERWVDPKTGVFGSGYPWDGTGQGIHWTLDRAVAEMYAAGTGARLFTAEYTDPAQFIPEILESELTRYTLYADGSDPDGCRQEWELTGYPINIQELPLPR